MCRRFGVQAGPMPELWHWAYQIFHGEELSYLVHLPPFGRPPTVVAYAPRCWGLRSVLDFVDLFGATEILVVKKPLSKSSEKTPRVATDPDLHRRLPTLYDFLTSTHYDGDAPGTREVGSLLIFAQEGYWKACCRDKQEARCLWVTAATFADLVTAVDEALGDDSSVWRDDRASGASQASRQKPQKGT